MRGIRAIFILLVFFALTALSVVGYNRCTDGFSVQELVSDLPYNVLFEISPINFETQQQLNAALGQPYRYIGKGCQFYAFESADGRYVLKFLKQKHLRLWTELNEIPLPTAIRDKANVRMACRRYRITHLFTSCKLAYEEMPVESGLLYVHLNRTPVLGKKVCIIDKLGLRHRLDLDHYEFILQRRAQPLTQLMSQIAHDQDFEALISERLDQLILLIRHRCEKGIRDRDRSFVKNVAFEGDRAIFIDVGQFYKDPSILLSTEQLGDIRKRLGNFQSWVNEKYPERGAQLKALIEEKLQKLNL